MTVLVVSEKGSRLSLLSMVRAPFTVIGTSNATGCGFTAESFGTAELVVSGVAPKVSESLMIGGILPHP